MTRLKNSDICDITSRLDRYDKDLLSKTGRTLFGIACHTCGVDESRIKREQDSFCIRVVPVTAGQGVISDFSQTVCAILRFLGFNAQVSDQPDTSGLAFAYENKADAVMMADDDRFVGINLMTRSVVDNTEMTGQVYASVLDLMAGGIGNKDVLVMGCGPVGESAARKLLSLNARLSLMDKNPDAARSLATKLSTVEGSEEKIKLIRPEEMDGLIHKYIVEATPSENTIPDSALFGGMVVAAPGVPLGISKTGYQILNHNLVHDKLELGVAAMAVSLLK